MFKNIFPDKLKRLVYKAGLGELPSGPDNLNQEVKPNLDQRNLEAALKSDNPEKFKQAFEDCKTRVTNLLTDIRDKFPGEIDIDNLDNRFSDIPAVQDIVQSTLMARQELLDLEKSGEKVSGTEVMLAMSRYWGAEALWNAESKTIPNRFKAAKKLLNEGAMAEDMKLAKGVEAGFTGLGEPETNKARAAAVDRLVVAAKEQMPSEGVGYIEMADGSTMIVENRDGNYLIVRVTTGGGGTQTLEHVTSAKEGSDFASPKFAGQNASRLARQYREWKEKKA
ncbi:hypothetical protein KJ657_03135 [Patescibacteria group bacterium]|nr:hypothetical protein [Patescibacteria group bacterium]MBU1016058.1 hypothetical protein [Patescibacteria group bacterium]MBU1685465.1 hypothetical protein [Patescibacteria group bacterium]MBU1938676.1 hypothetical protein [Patescibacteria group bacterium]